MRQKSSKLKTVILNECFLTKEHIKRLQEYGEVVTYNDTDSAEKAIERMENADVAIGDQFIVKFDKKVLESAKNLKLLALNTISHSYVDKETATKKGIRIANIPGFSKQAVAEFTLGLIFAINRKIVLADHLMRKKVFELDPGNKEHQKFLGYELKGKTIGIIGLGNIGTTVATLCKALGMNVVAHSRSSRKIEGIKMLSLQELLKTSDVITLHLPLTTETKNLISEKEINLMKPTAIIINTSQPEIINTEALYTALKSKKISGAALDVGTMINHNNLLFQLDNVVITPHMGSFTKEAFLVNMPNMIIENVEAFLKGKPMHIIN